MAMLCVNRELAFQIVKNLTAMQETRVRSLGWEYPLEKGIPPPVFLPGEFNGHRSLAVYSPWGDKESDMTEQLNTPACAFTHKNLSEIYEYVRDNSQKKK